MKFILSESERNTIVHGLCVAAERFQEHYQTLQKIHDDTLAREANRHLAEQFDKQARDSRELARLIEASDSVTVDGYPVCYRCLEVIEDNEFMREIDGTFRHVNAC